MPDAAATLQIKQSPSEFISHPEAHETAIDILDSVFVVTPSKRLSLNGQHVSFSACTSHLYSFNDYK